MPVIYNTNELGIFHANRTAKCLMNQSRIKGEGWNITNRLKPVILGFVFYVLFVALSTALSVIVYRV